MILPEGTIRRLQPLFPTLNLRSIQVQVTEPMSIAVCRCCPHAYIKAGSSPRPGLIMISPTFWNPESEEGHRLIAHEVYHQAQQTATPYFDALYDALAEEVERRGLPPWEHPMEVPAYNFEKGVSYGY